MNKIKIVFFCMLIPFFIFLAVILLKIKSDGEFRQKTVLAVETRKVLEHLMIDLREARQNTILDLPSDGAWHHRIAFDSAKEGALEYIIKEGHLFRFNKGSELLIADNIADLRIRRQKVTPDILEVQIEAQKDVSLVSNLKIRLRPNVVSTTKS